MSNEITTASIISLFDLTTDGRQKVVTDMISRIEEGWLDPIMAHYSIKNMEDILDQVKANPVYKDMVLSAAEKMGKSFEYKNSKVDIRETGVKYDYSKCGDPIMNEMVAQRDQLNARIKDREKFLRSIPAGGMQVLEDDEIVQVYPPSKSSTTTVAMTLK